MCGDIGGAVFASSAGGVSSLLPFALDLLFGFFWTAVYSSSTVCGGGIGGVSSSPFSSQSFGFLTAVYRSSIVWGELIPCFVMFSFISHVDALGTSRLAYGATGGPFSAALHFASSFNLSYLH